MELNSKAKIFINNDINKITDIGIFAHPDDIEIGCFNAIEKCQTNGNFLGVVLTDGAGSVRDGDFKDYTDEEMIAERSREQQKSAEKGGYSVIMLNYSSSQVKQNISELQADLNAIFKTFSPETIYTHNPFDRHKTHIATMKAVLKSDFKCDKIYGNEVWRGLDFLPDKYKVVFGIENTTLQQELMNIFKSQNCAKRYDIATISRGRANATFSQSHQKDMYKSVILGIDLTGITYDTISEFASKILQELNSEVDDLLKD